MLKRLIYLPYVLAYVLVFALELATPAQAEQKALIEFKVMTLETALDLARATLSDCRKRGYQVAVAVVDRFGNLQVALKDRFAGPHTPDTARRKAWTAISFGTDTLALAELTQPGRLESGIRSVTGVMVLPGGVPVQAAGSMVGGVGVSGASPEMDDACARAGIEAITEKLEF